MENKIKNRPKFARFQEKKVSSSPDFYKYVPVSSQEYRRILFLFFLLSYLVCSQIWLNHLMDDRHFNYIKKNLKKKGVCHVVALPFTLIKRYLKAKEEIMKTQIFISPCRNIIFKISRYGDFFKKILKNPFVGFASPFFFGCQVGRIRHKKKKKRKKTMNYESKQNIAPKKKKKNSGMELATYQSQIGKSTYGQLSILAKKKGLDKQETSIWRNIKIRNIINLAK
jgi:hypothetical protein